MKLTKSRIAKFVVGLAGFAIALSFVVTPVTTSAATIAELQAMITSLSAQLAALSGGTGSQQIGGLYCSITFTQNLTIGSTGSEVMALQKFLNSVDGTQLATVGAGSPGNETSYFGAITRAAVTKYQQKYGITPIAGYWGPISRAKAASLCAGQVVVVTYPAGCTSTSGYSPITGASCSTGTPVTPGLPTGGSITVTAGVQPANSLAPQSAARLPFTTFSVTAGSSDVTINSVTVQRVGLGVDAVFSGVVLLKSNGMQIGVSKTLNSNHQAIIGEPYVVRAGTTEVFTVAGNMAATLTSYAGQVVGLNVVAINTSATVTGSLPIAGAMHTINASLSLGTATLALSSYDPNSAQTKEIGVTGYKFAGVRVTAGNVEDVKLWSVRWNQSGTASASDLANVKVYVDGTGYDTVVSADGKYYSAVFPDGILIAKGASKDVYIQGDLAGANSAVRTVQFDLYKNTDLYVSGMTYGYGIIARASANCNAVASTATTGSEFINSNTSCATSGTIGSPFFSGSTVTIAGGSATSISKANSVPAGNVAINVEGQVLGGFTTDIKGEPISVQQMIFTVATTGTWTTNGVLTNVKIVDSNGATLATTDQPTNAASTLTFTDTVTFPIGIHTYTIVGKVPVGAPQGGTIILSSTPSSQWTGVTGQVTGNTVALTNGLFTTNTMTVRAASLLINTATAPSARSVIAGAQAFEFARITLDAGASGEDVRFGAIPLTYNGTPLAFAADETMMTTCQLFDTANPLVALNTGSNVVNPSTSVATTSTALQQTFTLDNQFTVPKGTVKTLSLKCNLSSTADPLSQIRWGTLSSNTMSVTGTSGADVTEVITTGVGQIMTVSANGSYTVVNDSSLIYRMAQAGSTGQELARFRFTAGATEAIDLKQIALVLGDTASSSPADLVGERVTLWNGATQIGSAQFGGANPDNATSTLLSPAPRIAAGDSVVITVRADLTAQGINDGTPGAFIAVNYDGNNNDASNGNYATGVDSQAVIPGSTTGAVASNGMRIFRTVPTIAVTSNGGTLTAGANLYTFTVTNPNNRDVVFYKFTFSIATSGASNITGFTLYGDGVAANTSAVNAVDVETLGPTLDAVEIVFSADSQARIVPANSTKTYILKASGVSNDSTVIDSLSLALLADTAFPSQPYLMGNVARVNLSTASSTNNTIWSPFSTTTPIAGASAETNLDWTNGYGMPGFPSNANFPVQTWTSTN